MILVSKEAARFYSDVETPVFGTTWHTGTQNFKKFGAPHYCGNESYVDPILLSTLKPPVISCTFLVVFAALLLCCWFSKTVFCRMFVRRFKAHRALQLAACS